MQIDQIVEINCRIKIEKIERVGEFIRVMGDLVSTDGKKHGWATAPIEAVTEVLPPGLEK